MKQGKAEHKYSLFFFFKLIFSQYVSCRREFIPCWFTSVNLNLIIRSSTQLNIMNAKLVSVWCCVSFQLRILKINQSFKFIAHHTVPSHPNIFLLSWLHFGQFLCSIMTTYFVFLMINSLLFRFWRLKFIDRLNPWCNCRK